MRVACIQYKSYEDEKKTLKKLIPLIYSAAKKKVDLITLPECATFLNVNKSDTMMNASFEKNSFSLRVIKEIAKNLDVNILIGSLQTLEYKMLTKKLFNRSFLINRKGKVICKYHPLKNALV